MSILILCTSFTFFYLIFLYVCTFHDSYWSLLSVDKMIIINIFLGPPLYKLRALEIHKWRQYTERIKRTSKCYVALVTDCSCKVRIVHAAKSNCTSKELFHSGNTKTKIEGVNVLQWQLKWDYLQWVENYIEGYV